MDFEKFFFMYNGSDRKGKHDYIGRHESIDNSIIEWIKTNSSYDEEYDYYKLNIKELHTILIIYGSDKKNEIEFHYVTDKELIGDEGLDIISDCIDHDLNYIKEKLK